VHIINELQGMLSTQVASPKGVNVINEKTFDQLSALNQV
jgi:hypothetical protein